MAPARGGVEANASQFPFTCKATQTFTRGCAAVIFQVGAVLAFVIFRAVTEIVHGKIEALGTILARIWLAIIYVQL